MRKYAIFVRRTANEREEKSRNHGSPFQRPKLRIEQPDFGSVFGPGRCGLAVLPKALVAFGVRISVRTRQHSEDTAKQGCA